MNLVWKQQISSAWFRNCSPFLVLVQADGGYSYNILKGEKECSSVCPIRDGQLVLKLLKHCQKDTIIFELLFYILCKILNSEQIPNKKL